MLFAVKFTGFSLFDKFRKITEKNAPKIRHQNGPIWKIAKFKL